MRTARWLIIIAAAIVVQNSDLLAVEIFGAPRVKPDLLLLLVILYGLVKGEKRGTVAGFLVGLAEDAFSVGYMGTNALCKTVAGFLSARFGRQFLWRRIPAQLLLVFTLSIVAVSIRSMLGAVLGGGAAQDGLAGAVLVSSLLNALFAPFVFFLAVRFTGDAK